MNTPPKVTIITVTYNRAGYLPYAIDSVLQQTCTDWELLIIDGGSTDATPHVVSSYTEHDQRIRYIRDTGRKNIAQNRNLALREARGTYIAVLDSDDIWATRDKLEKQLNFMTSPEHKDHVLVGTGVIEIDTNGDERRRYLNPVTDKNIRASILCRNPFAHSSVLFQRTAALEAGGYNETYVIGEDYDLVLRLGTRGLLANLPEYLVKYRVHPDSICVRDRITGARATQKIISQYKKLYPNYSHAVVKGYLRSLYMHIRQGLDQIMHHVQPH